MTAKILDFAAYKIRQEEAFLDSVNLEDMLANLSPEQQEALLFAVFNIPQDPANDDEFPEEDIEGLVEYLYDDVAEWVLDEEQ